MSNGQYIATTKCLPINYKLIALFACVICACGLSLFFTVSFWSAMGATVLSATVLGITGCVFEFTKFYALPAFLDFKKNKLWGRAVVSFSMFLVLSFISMLAGIYALNSNLNLNAERSNTQSTQYQMQLASIQMQEKKIERMMTLADQDLQSNFRKRAKDTLAEVNSEQAYLLQLKNELTQQTPNVETGLQLPFLNSSTTGLLVTVLGALLELTTTFLIVLFQLKRNGLPVVKKQLKAEQLKPEPSKVKAANKSNVTHFKPSAKKSKNVSRDKFGKYQEVVAKIKARALMPTQRSVKHYANIGSKTVAEFFRCMEEEGVLVKAKGNRYQLTRAA
jgi:hypothetical protein